MKYRIGLALVLLLIAVALSARRYPCAEIECPGRVWQDGDLCLWHRLYYAVCAPIDPHAYGIDVAGAGGNISGHV